MNNSGLFSSQFIPLLQPSTKKQQWTVTTLSSNILQQIHHKLAIVMVAGHNISFYSKCRTMLLHIDSNQQQQQYRDYIMYNKIQIGIHATLPNTSLEWVYIEYHHTNDSELGQLSALPYILPTYLIQEVNNELQAQQLIINCQSMIEKQNLQHATTLLPQIIIVVPKECNFVDKIRSKIGSYFKIGQLVQNCKNDNPLNKIDELIQQGRSIIEQIKPKIYLNNYISPTSIIKFINNFNTLKISQLLSQIHSDQLQISLLNSSLQSKLKIQAINDFTCQKNDLNPIFQYGKSLLHGQYKSIDRKIRVRQIYTLFAFKQQLVLFQQNFMKKIENCQSGKLWSYYHQYIFTRIFQGANMINSAMQECNILMKEKVEEVTRINVEMKCKIQQMEIKLREVDQLLSQQNIKIYQLEKRNAKMMEEQDQNQVRIKMQNLDESSRKNKQQYHQELQRIKQELRRQVMNMELQLKKKQRQCEELNEHYERKLKQLKIKNEELSNEIKIINKQSQQRVNDRKRQGKQHNVLNIQLKNKIAEIQILKDRIQQNEHNYNQRIELIQLKNEENRIEQNKLRQQVISYQLRQLKYRGIQDQLESELRRNHQQKEQYKQLQKQFEVLQEQQQFMKKENGDHNIKYQQLMGQAQELLKELNRSRKANSDTEYKNEINTKIKMAFKIVQNIEMNYRSMKKQSVLKHQHIKQQYCQIFL